MHTLRRFRWLLAGFAAAVFVGTAFVSPACAGMGATFPTDWTSERLPHSAWLDDWIDARLQAISFFGLLTLASGKAVQVLWNVARGDWERWPRLTYRRSLAFTLLWGVMFVVVLTMISGARELMTPGAWRKMGWTYELAKPPPRPDDDTERREGLAQLKLRLWTYAGLNERQFPDTPDQLGDGDAWRIPGQPGLTYRLVPGRRISTAGELLVCEPQIGSGDRLVLLTNGVVGTMPGEHVIEALRAAESTKDARASGAGDE